MIVVVGVIGLVVATLVGSLVVDLRSRRRGLRRVGSGQMIRSARTFRTETRAAEKHMFDNIVPVRRMKGLPADPAKDPRPR